MQAETLEAIQRSAAIPSMPMIATRCYEMTSDPNCNYDRLIELLSTDAGMAADVLRLSNSALFGVIRQVTSLKQAVTLLGVRRIRDLVLSRYLVHKLRDARDELIDIHHFWRRSLATGILAARIAEAAKTRGRDEAFLAGLLADVGVVILGRALPRQYGLITPHYRAADATLWTNLELAQLGVAHPEVSALVLEQWSLPQSIVDAVRHHHSVKGPMADAQASPDIAGVIGAAGDVARWLCNATATPDAAMLGCMDAMKGIGLDAGILATAMSAISADMQGMSRLLGVDVVDTKTFAAIGEKLAAGSVAAATV